MAGPVTLLLAAPNWLGDLVMATSLLDLFETGERRHGIPRPELHLSLRNVWSPLFSGDPRLAGIVPYARRGTHAGWRGAWRQAADWRRGRYTAALLLPPSLRAAAVARLSGIPRRLGFRGDARSILLSTPVARPDRGDLHYTEELALLYGAWADAAHGCAPPQHTAAPRPRLAGAIGSDDGHATGAGPPLWLLSVGATYGDAKSWPAARQAEMVEALLARGDVRVALIGDDAAAEAARHVRTLVDQTWRDVPGEAPGCYDLVGRTSLVDLVGLLRRAEVFVGNDSGPMHLAAALGTATVGIYGSSSTVWTRPLGARTTSVRAEGFACQPCYLRSCPRSHFCLEDIGARRVLAAADALRNGVGAGPICHRRPEVTDRDGESAPVLFLDRDGVIIEDTDYISDPEEVRLLPGSAAALKRAAECGLRLVIVTNQSGIGRGYYTARDFGAVQDRVDALLAAEGVTVDGVYACPHAPQDDCNCRKPRPGMLDEASRSLRWHTARAWLVGDKLSDLALGRHFGLGTYLVETGRGRAAACDLDPGWGSRVMPDLAGAVDDILEVVRS